MNSNHELQEKFNKLYNETVEVVKYERNGKTTWGVFIDQHALVKYLNYRPGLLSKLMDDCIDLDWKYSNVKGDQAESIGKLQEKHLGEGLTVAHALIYMGWIAGHQIKLCFERGLITPMKDALGRKLSDMSELRQQDLLGYPSFQQMYPVRFAHLKLLEFNEDQKAKLFLFSRRLPRSGGKVKRSFPVEILMLIGKFLFASHIIKPNFSDED